MRWIVGLVLAFGLLAGCGSKTPPPAPAWTGLTGTVWKWVGVEGGAPASVDQPARYTVEFLVDRRYSVRADCNSGRGSWSVTGDGIRLTGGPMTMMACEEGSHDARFLELLDRVSAFSRDGDTLTLVAGEERMKFEAMPKVALAGTSWLVRAVNNGRGAVASVVLGSELTVEFGEEGNVSGSAGCNRFNGSYEVSGQTVSFSPLATTRRMCMEEGVVEQEGQFLAAMATVATWEIRGERAQLRTADGALAVDLVAAVTGVALVRTREALPPDAVLTVRLEDVSRADAPATLMGENRYPLAGLQSPLPFTVDFDPATIDPARSYAVRATITREDELMFTTTTVCPVLTRDGGQFGLELDLESVGD